MRARAHSSKEENDHSADHGVAADRRRCAHRSPRSAFLTALQGAASIVLALMASVTLASELQQFGFDDLMKVRKITAAVIAEQGDWIAYAVEPDRGDGEAFVQQAHGPAGETGAVYRVPLGADPALSNDSRWAALRLRPSFVERDRQRQAKKENGGKEADELHDGLTLLATADGERVDYRDVQAFAFAKDSQWLLVHFHPVDSDDGSEEDEEEEGEPEIESGGETEAASAKSQELKEGGRLLLRRLGDGAETELEAVERFALSDSGRYLAYSRATASGEQNALILRALSSGEERTLLQAEMADHPALVWSEDRDRLALLSGKEEKEGETTDLELGWLDADARERAAARCSG